MPIRISDLPAPVTASKADWLPGTTWMGFTPSGSDSNSRIACQTTVQHQFGSGYVIEYITEKLEKPNPGFENSDDYRKLREEHPSVAGRFLAVHRLRATSRPLEEILGPEEFKRVQDQWAQDGRRYRWSVAFPIIETYEIVGKPRAKDILGEEMYHRLYRWSTGILRRLEREECEALSSLELELREAPNAWIGIEDEIRFAEMSEINSRTINLLNRDLAAAMEGVSEERKAKVRKRAAWLADKFLLVKQASGKLTCDVCHFDPTTIFDPRVVSPRSLLDVHHRNPLEEGKRYTTIMDFALLCPTCHRIEHKRLKLSEPQKLT